MPQITIFFRSDERRTFNSTRSRCIHTNRFFRSRRRRPATARKRREKMLPSIAFLLIFSCFACVFSSSLAALSFLFFLINSVCLRLFRLQFISFLFLLLRVDLDALAFSVSIEVEQQLLLRALVAHTQSRCLHFCSLISSSVASWHCTCSHRQQSVGERKNWNRETNDKRA